MTLDDLLAEREIYRALTLFARAMDARDWQALATITTEDITADIGTGPLAGRAALIADMRSFLDDCGPTQHLLGNVLIEVQGDRASSQAYVSDMHIGQGDKSHLTFSTLGDYRDQWKKVDGGWRMHHRTKLNRAHIGSLEVLGAGPAGWL
jgi:hypothetical protein